jgi:hypothetical protein
VRRHGREAPIVSTHGVFLYWLPLGAGGHSVRLNGRVFEAVAAGLERRRRCDLYHSALELRLAEARFVIEMAPIPRRAAGRGVVAEGPVGSPLLRRLRLFRYEIRCWRGGLIPDVAEAVESPRLLTGDPAVARRVLRLLPAVPTPTWGRDQLGTGSMWNSNSLTSWLLALAGLEPELIHLPAGGRAPGWEAGVVAARRLGPAVVAGDGDRRHDHDRRDHVREDQRPVAERNPVGEPEQEADEEHAHVADRHTMRGAVLDDLADLEDGGDGHRDPPRRRCKREGGDHVSTVPTIVRWPDRPERS